MIRYIACKGQVEKDGDAVGTLVDILDLLHVILIVVMRVRKAIVMLTTNFEEIWSKGHGLDV